MWITGWTQGYLAHKNLSDLSKKREDGTGNLL